LSEDCCPCVLSGNLLIRQRDEIEQLQRKYDLLASAVNDDAQDCDEECNSFAHTEACDERSNFANTIIRQRDQIEQLRGTLEQVWIDATHPDFRTDRECVDAITKLVEPYKPETTKDTPPLSVKRGGPHDNLSTQFKRSNNRVPDGTELIGPGCHEIPLRDADAEIERIMRMTEDELRKELEKHGLDPDQAVKDCRAAIQRAIEKHQSDKDNPQPGQVRTWDGRNVTCWAPGERCGACDHYYSKADKCDYAPQSEKDCRFCDASPGSDNMVFHEPGCTRPR